MTTDDHVPGRFPLSSALAWLTAATLLATLAGAAILNWAYPSAVDVGMAMLLLAGGNWLIAALGLALVSAVTRQGGMVVTLAYFAGASVRFIFNLLAVLFLAVVRQGDILTIFIALALAYLPLLLVEAGLIGAYLWRQDSTGRPASPGAPSITEAVA